MILCNFDDCWTFRLMFGEDWDWINFEVDEIWCISNFLILKLVSFSNFRLVVAQIVNNWTMMRDQDKIWVFTKVCWTGSNTMRNQEIIQLHRSFSCKIQIFDTLFEVFGTVDQFLVGCPICMNLDLFVGYTTRNGLPGIVYFWLIRRPIFTDNCRIYLRYLKVK